MNTKFKEYKSFAKEVTAKYEKRDDVHRMKITSSTALAEFARKVYPVDIGYREAFMVVFLNQSNNTIGYTVVSIGGLTGTMVDVRLTMQHALIAGATRFIMVHNHPSGGLQPSYADKELTKKMKKAGELLDIDVLDHIILTEDDYFSFADNHIL